MWFWCAVRQFEQFFNAAKSIWKSPLCSMSHTAASVQRRRGTFRATSCHLSIGLRNRFGVTSCSNSLMIDIFEIHQNFVTQKELSSLYFFWTQIAQATFRTIQQYAQSSSTSTRYFHGHNSINFSIKSMSTVKAAVHHASRRWDRSGLLCIASLIPLLWCLRREISRQAHCKASSFSRMIESNGATSADWTMLKR